MNVCTRDISQLILSEITPTLILINDKHVRSAAIAEV